jgi:hypothetical protein
MTATAVVTTFVTRSTQRTLTQFQTDTLAKRAVQTPAYISTWAPSRIAAACSAVATGVVTNTITRTAAVPLITQTATNTISDAQTITKTLKTNIGPVVWTIRGFSFPFQYRTTPDALTRSF